MLPPFYGPYDQAGSRVKVIRASASGIALHDGETAPDRVFEAGCLECHHLGPSISHRISSRVSIDTPRNAYSGNITRPIVPMPRLVLQTMATILAVGAAIWERVAIAGSFSCTKPMTTPVEDLLSPPKPLMCRLSLPGKGSARSGPGYSSFTNGFFVPRNCSRIGVPGSLNVSRRLFTR
jgi:hypothetical protein